MTAQNNHAWDAENRLTSIAGTTTASYRYDYQGRRNGKTAGATTSYLYDGLNLLRETAAAPVDYLFGPGIDEPIAVSEGGSVQYPLVDGLGSVAGLSSSSGAIANLYAYDAWGVTRSQSGTVSNSFGYTSREFGEAGLSFYRARFYNQSAGRFLSEDPLQLNSLGRLSLATTARTGGSRAIDKYLEATTPYSYVLNNPIAFNDPEGLRPQIPGCDKVPCWFESERILDCCHDHDECFRRNDCSASSWLYTGLVTSPMKCVRCNLNAVDCIGGYRKPEPAPDRWKEEARKIDPRRRPRWFPSFIRLSR